MSANKHIFVVDDDIYLAEMVKQTLLAEGYVVTVFNDGGDVLENIAKNRPDLVLLDIKIPGLDGNEILKQIHSEYDISVIMLTGVNNAESMALSLDLGADDYIVKPFHPEELIARIKSKFRRYNLSH